MSDESCPFYEMEKNFVDVVQRVIPSVVSVSVTKLAQTQLYSVVPVQGQGSGVIVSADGYIVTNNHVIAGSRDVEVTLYNGSLYKAALVGRSPQRDIAVLRIKAPDLKPIVLGDSSSLRVGQFAIAIGNPLGLGLTVTFGMVSAVDRTIGGDDVYLEGLIQTSAQINPGNSGGALVDTAGRLIGVPTAMVPWSQGIGFAIAVDGIKSVIEELIQTGTVRTPWMGVVGVTLNRRISSYYDLPVDTGALLVQVPRGPAMKAGLRPGDIVVAVDDVDIDGMESLRKLIMKKRVGDKISVRFVRQRDIFETYIQLQDAP
ncbi:MAG: trypsin-like peptidase domain-containing protein [Candidatus Thorarchaeota archaeon]